MKITSDEAEALSAEAASAPAEPLGQADIDTCAGVRLANSSDIATLFASAGGFIAWYNANLSAKPTFAHRGAISTRPLVAQRFNAFWDQIPAVFGTPAISAVEFSALMSIGIQENTGDFFANAEGVGKPPDFPGLIYAFEAIPGLKSSYNVNTGLGNFTAFRLFNDADFVDAHRNAAGFAAVTGGGIAQAWNTAVWPAGFPHAVDANVNGFVMEADFYKFRGRGVIQTTGRDDYAIMVDFILANAQNLNNPALLALKAEWDASATLNPASSKRDVIASRSTNAQWDTAFNETVILAAGVAEDSSHKSNYLKLSHSAATLNGGTSQAGSLFFMARKINGGNYPNVVVPMMKTMIRAIAAGPAAAGT